MARRRPTAKANSNRDPRGDIQIALLVGDGLPALGTTVSTNHFVCGLLCTRIGGPARPPPQPHAPERARGRAQSRRGGANV